MTIAFHNLSFIQYALGFISGYGLNYSLFSRFIGFIALQIGLRFATTSTKQHVDLHHFDLGFLSNVQIAGTLIELMFHKRLYSFLPAFLISLLQWIGLIGAIGSQIVIMFIDLEVFTKDKRLRQIFSEVRLNNVFVPIEQACFIAWFAYVQLSIGNFVSFGYSMHRAFVMYTGWIRARKPVEIPVLREEENRGILKLPVFDGRHSIANVSLYSLFLGIISGIGVSCSLSTSKYAVFGIFLFFLSLFHQMEYLCTVKYQPASLSSTSN
jgi:hypothetical protein